MALRMQSFRELKVWAKAHELTLALYRITASFPKAEMFGLTSQVRRAASSVGANLAEGCGRNGKAEFSRFCSIAMGSASELEYHLLLARDLELLSADQYQELSDKTIEVKRMLAVLIQKVRA
jgi:four helix bundle protein